MTTLRKADYLAALDRDAGAFRAAAAPDTLDRPVPSCPGWTVHRLVAHVTLVYRRAGDVLRRGTLDRPAEAPSSADAPAGAVVLDAFDEAYAGLADALKTVPEDTPAWNFAPWPKTAAFWHRRVAVETGVHLWDAQTSVGVTAPVDDRLAAEGVAEVFDCLLPAGVRKGPTDLTGLVHLIADDIDAEWFVRLRGERIALLDADSVIPEEHPTQTRATGAVSDLLLSLYGRVPFDVLTVEGDPALLPALRTG